MMESDDCIDDSLIQIPLFNEPYLLALPPHMDKIHINSFHDLTNLHFIRFTRNSVTGKEIERYLRWQRYDIEKSLEFDSASAILPMVSAGIGWSIMPPLCLLQSGCELSNICLRHLPGSGLNRNIVLVHHKQELHEAVDVIGHIANSIFLKRCLPSLIRQLPILSEYSFTL
ncbi:LysR family transcriptional regulator substrate-binding protein [Endozoicomonas sp. Mp262]|uniref:LysR family transcriptional regulator substrate-binding protein n=1 Tax=Endozoicomonas sp. Mp262 TaxID=2919499 RepID=UPI0021D89670